jgi:hypothetical protein
MTPKTPRIKSIYISLRSPNRLDLPAGKPTNRNEIGFKTFYDEEKVLKTHPKKHDFVRTESRNKTEDLICNNCYNKNITFVNKSIVHPNILPKNNDNVASEENDNLKFNETLNTFYRSKIDDKINTRIEKTRIASKSIENFRVKTKENFQTDYENQTNFFDTMRDSVLERAREKAKKKELIIANNLDKFLTPESVKVTKYYTNYIK